jgi:PA-IL-like protein
VQVNANSRETDTGIDLRAGDRVSFSAGGSVYSRGTDAISPEGNRYYDKRGENYPMRDSAFGSLVGYIRTSYGQTRPFYIGSSQTVTVPESGRLILMINDNDYGDNNGFFRVRVFY